MELDDFIKENNVDCEIIDKEDTRHTIDAGMVLNIPPEQMIKALVCLAFKERGKEYFLGLVNGKSKLDMKKISKYLNARRVVILDAKTSENVSGYPPGGTPPIGHKQKLTVIMDQKLAEQDMLWGGGGATTKAMRIKPSEIIRVSEAKVADISEPIE